jgi:signal transduction histidine kinase
MAIVVAFAAVGFLTLAQGWLFPRQASGVLVSGLLQFAGLGVALFGIAKLKDFDRLRIVGLLATVWIIACGIVVVVRLDELGAFAEALVCLQVGAALVIPWGLAIQALAGLASVLAYLAAMTLLGRRDVGNLADLLWICCGGALAGSAAYLLERARRALFCHRVRDREIISSFSHDIRAPASAISMQTDLVDELSQDEEIRSRMQAIRASATQVLNLAQNMVDSIRIEEGKMTLRPERVDLNDLVSETVLEQESLARVKRVDVALELSLGLPAIHSDPLQLKRVIINLLSNGLNVTPASGRVVLSTGMASDWVKISVKDGGPGLGPGEREQLFARFSGLARRSRGGIGLGLFIVKDIVARCGGRIEVESAPGDGAIFSVLLPLRAPE